VAHPEKETGSCSAETSRAFDVIFCGGTFKRLESAGAGKEKWVSQDGVAVLD